MNKSMVRGLAIVLGLLLQGPAGAADTSAVHKRTRHGPVLGVDDSAASGTYYWKGVPFAQPPVGSLRWRAPVELQRWKEVRPTQQFGNACAQYGRIYGPGANNRYDPTIATTLGTAVGSEDCLYLNIWRPATTQARLPVIVFVHGGSNVSGYTADPVYDGAALARTANAVVVSVNYRLGIFGFLSVPSLTTGDALEDSGNFALLDLFKGLEFVQENIARFGGNPSRVTLMGQSAGAINVWALMTSPLAVEAPRKPFHRVMPMSGGISLASNLPPGSLPTLNPASTYLAQGNKLLEQQLIADGEATDEASAAAWIASRTPEQVADWLRSRPPAALLSTLLTRLAPLGLAGSGPIADGAVLPVDPIAAIAAGDYLRVPVLASTTRDEAKLFPTFLTLFGTPSGRLVTDQQLFDIQYAYLPDDAPQITIESWIPAFYLPVTTPVTGFNAMTDQLNAIFFVRSRDNVLDTLRTQQDAVWYYQFDWDEEPAPFDDIYGAAHAFDLPFVFGNFGPSLFSNVANSTANRPGRLALSEAMMRSVGAFARNGDPNDPASLGVAWPAWPGRLHFDATATDKQISVP